MNIEKYLANFKKEIDREIAVYLDDVIKDFSRRDFLVAKTLKDVKKLVLAGGKRLRPALMYQSYLSMGGKDKERMLKTAVSIELIHFFLLIHDDIIDRDFKRHGQDTINFKYEKLAGKIFPQKDKAHFGKSVAIIVGDMINALGSQIIYNSGFDPNLIVKALCKLQDIISYTVIGQTKDIYLQIKGKATEKEVLEMYEHKTAKYTFEGSLHLGAVLGGADDKTLDALTKIAIPMGIAFQIRDDILGLFGSERKIGKLIGSDIKEGKQTILLARAREKADKKQKEILKNLLGERDLQIEEIKSFQKVIQETGALDYASDLINKKIRESKKAIEKINIKPENKEFLLAIADYVGRREI